MLRRSAWLVWLALLPSVADRASAQCTTGGPGGTYPGPGAVNGVWNQTLPTPPLVSALPVSFPSGPVVIQSIVLHGLTHAYGGDTHVVLESPTGALYNLAVLADFWTPGGNGCGTPLGGDYTIVDPLQLSSGCSNAQPFLCGSFAPGTYAQEFGSWTSGQAGVHNVPLESIPVVSGTWKLRIYDWFPTVDDGQIASWDLCVGAPSPRLWSSVAGGGGSFPAPNAFNGVWPTTLPTGQLEVPISVAIPAGASRIEAVRLRGLNHPWSGDCQIVLQDPSGAKHNLFQNNNGAFGGGCGGDFAGDYAFVDSLAGDDPCGGPTSPFSCSGLPFVAEASYRQSPGSWPHGASGIFNTPLASIPLYSGTWKLIVYDWFVGSNHGTLDGWDLCFDACPEPRQCISGGGGGAFPLPGAVDGTWPNVLPTGALVCPLPVVLPAGATRIAGVKLHGLSHPWLGDCHLVLQDPGGTQHTLFQDAGGNWCSGDFAGDYTFVDFVQGTADCGAPARGFLCSASPPPGTYVQTFGGWPSGASGIFNTPLESIPISNGIWNLIIYDWWVTGDDGSLASWDLCFDTSAAPRVYCPSSAPGSTNGCLPRIAATGNPDVSHTSPCVITVADVEGQKSGLLFYGVSGPHNSPWCNTGSSFLCVKAPTQRTPTQVSGGTAGACDGQLALDWNAYQLSHPGALGSPWTAGSVANVQGWFRDPPSCKTTFLTEAMELTYQP